MSELIESQIAQFLRQQRLQLATAESCTGGLIGHRITNIPGASDYYPGGVVCYAYQAKVDLLGVSWETLNTYGAVSPQTVLEMARGARRLLQADLALAVSGIAGPGGGTAEKPVGTTWLGLASARGEWTRLHTFDGSREQNKTSAAQAGLQFVLDFLQNGAAS